VARAAGFHRTIGDGLDQQRRFARPRATDQKGVALAVLQEAGRLLLLARQF
jgi:hypothetical protein